MVSLPGLPGLPELKGVADDVGRRLRAALDAVAAVSVVLQVIPGCPNTTDAQVLLQQALLDAGLPARRRGSAGRRGQRPGAPWASTAA